ncbi:charged multivesicular body protein 3, partial [Elysia marginata]
VTEWTHKLRKEGNNIERQIRATLRVAGALAKSTEVMQSMQQLIKLPEIQATMREMSKEMMKAGIIEEMMDDTMEALDDEELDEEADEEVDKVLYEITAGELGKAPEAVDDSLPVLDTEGAKAAKAGPSRSGATAVALGDDDDDDDIDEMKARLEALRS